jgi:hypothetical protein
MRMLNVQKIDRSVEVTHYLHAVQRYDETSDDAIASGAPKLLCAASWQA